MSRLPAFDCVDAHVGVPSAGPRGPNHISQGPLGILTSRPELAVAFGSVLANPTDTDDLLFLNCVTSVQPSGHGVVIAKAGMTVFLK
jgi:hypothetical protein